MRIAIIGTGIGGLGAAHRLHPHHDLTLFEAGGYIGGHTRDGRRRDRGTALGRGHRLHRLQRLDLSELRRAAARARRRVTALGHELLAALRAHRLRVQRHVAEHAVRATPEPAPAVVPAHADGDPVVQRPRATQPHSRRSAPDARGLPARARLLAAADPAIPRADGPRDLVGERSGDAVVPGPLLHRLLPATRLPRASTTGPNGVRCGADRAATSRTSPHRSAIASGCTRR